MLKYKSPYQTRTHSIFFYVSWCAVLMMPIAVAMIPPARQEQRIVQAPPVIAEFDGTSFIPNDTPPRSVLPTVLAREDIALYDTIFQAQKKADWAQADAAISRLHNKLLMGHVLAERYLSRSYTPTPNQLVQWLNQYNDHPQAQAIYSLTMTKSPALKSNVPVIRKQPTLEGYGDDNGLVALRDEDMPYAKTWHAGLQAWKNGHKDAAAKLFASMNKYEMSPWMESAADYWAYRSFDAIGQKKEARQHLTMAAAHPRSFYGILARKQLRQDLNLDHQPVTLTDNDMLAMVGDQSVRRVVALAQAGMTELAEKELRLRFPQAEGEDKPRLLALAHELGLASVQISMAKQLRSSDHELDFARYPLPTWRPEGGFKIDPLLLFALMRQESGFRPSAVSSGGALGLMQLMPQTASFMQKKMDRDGAGSVAGNVAEPVPNMTLGQNYVEHLLDNDLVDGNLIYLLAAYNAGPGRLQEWKGRFTDSDPLLFVESIPFGQTRNYVMQVMTNYWIYAELDGSENRSVYALMKGRWPSYKPYAGAVATRAPLASANGA